MQRMIPRFRSLRVRLLFTIAAAVGVALLTVALIIRDATADQFERYVASSRAEVQLVAAEVAELTKKRVIVNRIVGPDGDIQVIADSVEVPPMLRELRPAPRATELERATAPRQAPAPVLVVTEETTTRMPEIIAVRAPAVVDPEGVFRTSVSQALLFGVLAGGLAATMLTLVLSRTILGPVHALTTAARKMAQGDLAQRVAIGSTDEIGDLARAFNTMAESVARTERLRRTMVSDVAHELRTPLSNLRGYLEALSDGVASPTPELIASLHEEAVLLSRLVDDLQELSLAEAGQLRLERQPVSLAELVVGAIQCLEPRASAQRLALRADLPPDLPFVDADPARIAQVLRNLLANAIAHTPPGGEIVVTAIASGDCAIVHVRDTGVGIPPEHLPHVFERFYRADSSRARSTGGTGIGLAIVKELVQAHGGHVAIESAPGVGTTASFTLPVASLHAISRNGLPRPILEVRESQGQDAPEQPVRAQ